MQNVPEHTRTANVQITCATAQSDQNLRCQLTKSLGKIYPRYIAKAQSMVFDFAGKSGSVLFAHDSKPPFYHGATQLLRYSC